MLRVQILLLALLGVLVVGPSGAASAEGPGCAFGTLQGGGCKETKPGGPRRPPEEGGGGSQPVSSAPYQQYTYAPTCSGNNLQQNDVLCNAAVMICDNIPGAPANAIAFWVWSRLYDPTKLEAAQPPYGRQPGYTCIGPDGPSELPTPAQAAAQVQRDFKSFVVAKGATVVNPGTTTLINVATIFSTDRAEPITLAPLTILTHPVVITITPESYTWYFGDGSTLTTTEPGRPGVKDVTHVYSTPSASVSAHVVISWSGTFTVDGGEPLTVRGQAQTVGPETALRVASARSELVSK